MLVLVCSAFDFGYCAVVGGTAWLILVACCCVGACGFGLGSLWFVWLGFCYASLVDCGWFLVCVLYLLGVGFGVFVLRWF